ncbi:hypothetical protein D3C87_1092530 [compost metagenome]
MRAQVRHGLVDAWFARYFEHLGTGFAQRELGLGFLAGGVVQQHVARQPLVEEQLDVLARGEAADLVAHDRLHVVRDARSGEDVLQLRGKPGVGVGDVGVVLLLLLRRLGAEERGVVGAFAVHQRNETEVRQLFLAAVGDGDLGRALEGDFAVIGLEGVGRQAFDQTATFDPANRHAPAVARKRVGDPGAQGIRGVHPQVLVVIATIDAFNEVELLDRRGIRPVRQATQHVGQGQADITRVFGGAERLPLGVFDGVENLRQIPWAGHVGKRIPAKQLRRGRRDEGGVGCRRDVGNLFEQVHVFRAAVELVVTQQHAERCTTEGAVLFFVDLLEQRALVEFGSGLEVAYQVFLRSIEQVDLQRSAGFGLVDLILQAAPGRFQLLEFTGVHDLVHLLGEHRVDLGDARIEHGDQVLARRHFAFQDLVDQLADQVAGAGALGLGAGHAALRNDAVEQRGLRGEVFHFNQFAVLLSHGLLVVHRQAPTLCRRWLERRLRDRIPCPGFSTSRCSATHPSAALRACRCRPSCCAGPPACCALPAACAAARLA